MALTQDVACDWRHSRAIKGGMHLDAAFEPRGADHICPPLDVATRRCAMKMSVMKFVVALATALTLTAEATVSFAQSRSCIPQYDGSGAQRAPYCYYTRSH